jgi:hypothetical protein
VLYNRASSDANGAPWDPKRSGVRWTGAAWVGDVPDIKADSPPGQFGAFIMNPEGVARLFAPLNDGPFPEQRLRIYWRFLETQDEYFHYSEKSPPPQGDWRIYGIGLPREVLEKVYYQNACRIIPGLSKKLQSFVEPGP